MWRSSQIQGSFNDAERSETQNLLRAITYLFTTEHVLQTIIYSREIKSKIFISKILQKLPPPPLIIEWWPQTEKIHRPTGEIVIIISDFI